MTKGKTPKTGLTKKHWFGYMLGDWGGCMTFALMGSFVTRYYTNVLHVNTNILAILLVIWNIWDAVNDPMMGALMDKMFAKKHYKNGKFRPWLLRSTPMLAITSIIFWTVPTMFEGTVMIIVLFICKIAYEACYTMFNIPMGSLLSAMANNDQERASLSSARGVGGMIGNMLPLVLFPMFLSKYGDSDPTGYAIGATICALVGAVVCFGHYFFTEESNIVESSADAGDIKFTDILDVFKKNKAFLALCIHGICICSMQYVTSTLGTYMYADVLGDVSLMSMASVISMAFMIVVLVFSPMLAKKFGLVPVIRASLLAGSGLYISLFGIQMIMDISPIVYMIWSSLASGISMMSVQMQWGMVGEAIDYNEYLTGKRTEGSIYGTFNLTRRIGQTIGNSAAVLALGWIGYDATLAAAGGVQAATVLTGIKVLCVLVPGIFVLGSWFAFKYVWNITPDIKTKIDATKAAKVE